LGFAISAIPRIACDSYHEAAESYEIRPRREKHGFHLISDALPFGRLWFAGPNAIANPIKFAKFYSRSHDAVIRVYDESGNVIETHEHKGEFREW